MVSEEEGAECGAVELWFQPCPDTAAQCFLIGDRKISYFRLRVPMRELLSWAEPRAAPHTTLYSVRKCLGSVKAEISHHPKWPLHMIIFF